MTLLHPPTPASRAATRPRSHAALPALPAAVFLAVMLAMALLWLPGCGGQPRPQGELLRIQDEEHRIANPARIGATATGKGCGSTRQEALTSAQRVAQFNLRSLTGQARYNVRFDLVGETRTTREVCIEVSALAVEPVPYER